MFGGPRNSATPPPNAGRPKAGEVAQITGNLTHIFVTDELADRLRVFHNGMELPAGSIESLSVEIVAPSETAEGILAAVLSRYETGANGERTQKTLSLFPGTVDLVARGRRISITCASETSFDGLYLRFGTENDGIGLEANGVKSLRMVVTPELLDVRLVWVEDGSEDVIFG